MNDDPRPLPLAGVRVLDFGQFIAVPFCTLWMAWLGAEVIVVESGGRMTARGAPPFADGLEGNVDASGYFNTLYAGKKSCQLDLATDARLRAALRPLTATAVVVIVAQRVSTIRTADQILVLEDGRIVGRGTHHELVETCRTYAEIVESQLSAEEAA